MAKKRGGGLNADEKQTPYKPTARGILKKWGIFWGIKFLIKK